MIFVIKFNNPIEFDRINEIDWIIKLSNNKKIILNSKYHERSFQIRLKTFLLCSFFHYSEKIEFLVCAIRFVVPFKYKHWFEKADDNRVVNHCVDDDSLMKEFHFAPTDKIWSARPTQRINLHFSHFFRLPRSLNENTKTNGTENISKRFENKNARS